MLCCTSRQGDELRWGCSFDLGVRVGGGGWWGNTGCFWVIHRGSMVDILFKLHVLVVDGAVLSGTGSAPTSRKWSVQGYDRAQVDSKTDESHMDGREVDRGNGGVVEICPEREAVPPSPITVNYSQILYSYRRPASVRCKYVLRYGHLRVRVSYDAPAFIVACRAHFPFLLHARWLGLTLYCPSGDPDAQFNLGCMLDTERRPPQGCPVLEAGAAPPQPNPARDCRMIGTLLPML